MKKLLFLLAAVCFAATANAQLVQSTTVTRTQAPPPPTEERFSGMFLEPSVGTSTVKGEGTKEKVDATILGVSLGYRQGFNRYLAWDIIGVQAITNVDYFEEDLYVQGITALRGTTPSMFGMSLFASAGVGYGYWPDMEWDGLVYELKFGINLTRWLNLGYKYNNQSIGEGVSVGYSAFNLGFKF